jgi:hypothetical protein
MIAQAVLSVPVGEHSLGGYDQEGAADTHGEGRRDGAPGTLTQDQE